MSKRVVITGYGVISPLGQDVESFENNLFSGVCGIRPQTFLARGQEVVFSTAHLTDFKPEQWIDAKKVPLQDRVAQLGVAAAVQAVRHSGFVITPENAETIGVIVGTGVGGQNTQEESYTRLLDPNGSGRVHPFTIPRLMVNAATSHISMATGIKGPGFTVASACASAVHAIGTTVAMLRSGLMDAALTGGTESCLTYGTLKGWEALRVMSPDLCRPFSAGRNGMVIGEGAAMFMMETLDHAVARGATIYAEILGFGMSCDAADLTTPDAEGAGRAIANCLRDAGLQPEDVDYINAHGTGTRINDATETKAIKAVFGNHAKKLAISSSKSMFGHALGAAGALETLATLLAIRRNIAPPTINYQEADPDCDLDYVVNTARPMPIRVALNNSFAFGGLNAVIALKAAS